MKELVPNELFDLTEFAHASLFDGSNFVWEALQRIEDYLKSLDLGRIESEIPDSTWLINASSITIEPNCVIEEGAYIRGPCYISRGSTVRNGAYIRGNVICGERSVIGHASEVKNSIFLNGAQAAHFAYVGDSILGGDVNLGAGTKLANLKFNGHNIVVKFNGKRFLTNLRKFGAILGDRAQTGCNSVTNPGTIFGKGAMCYPCSLASGVIMAGQTFRGTK